MLTRSLEFVPERAEEILKEIPAAPAVFLLRAADASVEPYVSKTANLHRRLQRLLGNSGEHSKKLNLRAWARSMEYTETGSEFESGFLLYQLLRTTFPRTYSRRLRFRFAPFVKLHLHNTYPRASITTRLGRLDGRSLYYGPFSSRAAAEQFANDSLDFFKLRRCVEDLHPDPQFPGCIYSEMKMCLAPCFKGCTDDDYSVEVGRVRAYFDSAGESLVREVSTTRDHASSALDFEGAAALHAKVEKLHSLIARVPEIVRRVDLLNGVLVQSSAKPECVSLFRIQSGCIFNPIQFSIQPADHAKSQSTESRIAAALAVSPPAPLKTSLEAMEHLALLKRWFYRTNRAGEAFWTDGNGELPMRRLVRGISRIYLGDKTDSTAPSAGVGPV